ncbi:SDR family NAD(P)-dependent oxidoreductase [Erythrobacter oryzae]|uniref:SDR family NAD(P)-dependent oxidoreductase n=1 Tax=Erythrobacter oryzae TaxID=3019556 RepID=UPI0025534875|nr:SDR family NAD(P)-dependent oxidoreductase [Erythrobacter sp. COR-2]
MHIVMTGGTSGFGAEAAARMAQAGHRLTLGARTPFPDTAQTRVLPLDLEDLATVDAFAAAVRSGDTVDALVLNAGLQLAKPGRMANGMEKTFFVNHLAHVQLLARLLDWLPAGARVVLTGSGTHDPAEKTPVTPPDHADARRLAFPETDPALPQSARKQAFRAYSSSKLANIMTARHLARLRSDLSVMAYDPGYVPWTGLGRANGRVIAAIASLVVPRLMAGDRSSTVALSGGFLADLATAPAYRREQGSYWSVRNPALVRIEPSALAQDDAAAAKLWDDSLALLGLA